MNLRHFAGTRWSAVAPTWANLYQSLFFFLFGIAYCTAPTVIALLDQINVQNGVTSPHMISRSYVHPCTLECTHVSTYTSLASVDPPWGQEHRRPCGFLPHGIMLGRYFSLLGWLLDLVFIGIGNLFSLESMCREREKERDSTEEGRGHQRRALIRPGYEERGFERGRLEEAKGGKCPLLTSCEPPLKFFF